MGKLLRALGSAIGVTLIVALSLSLCIWFLGGFLGIGDARPLESLAGRLVGLGLLWIVALLVVLVALLRAQRRDAAMTEEIVAAADAVPPGDTVVREELEEMRGKLRAALGKLRRSKLGRGHLYELPWYVIIGPPGAGKTTAIVNSGLQFPLAEEMGKTAIGGVGGTRNCDWWFTDKAVLVDTAGRYTTHESDSAADNAAWLGFLGILKKYRTRQPINGALVAISLSDLSLQDEQTRAGHAAAIRRRLTELREKLGVRVPVYVLFTKSDLLAGFIEFFDPLGKEARGQVWGFTLPLGGGAETSPLAAFDAEYGALLARLNAQSLDRMQAETDAGKRSLIAGFPGQVASLRGVAKDFLEALVQDNRFEHAPMLRGVYFTSGTQEGSPIDRLMMGMARTFGIGRQALGTGSGAGRSYFLTRLFEDVVFRESGLVSADDRVERRYRWSRRAAIAATVLVALGMGTAWTRSYMGNADLIAQTQAQAARFAEAEAMIPPSPVSDTDLPAIVPSLNILRDLPSNPAGGAVPVPAGLGWGLYQGRVIGTQSEQAYRAALNDHMLPRLLLRLEEQMQGNINNPDLLYEALKVYLMLGLIGPMNADLVSQWMEVDWLLAYPGPQRADLRADLGAHLAAMLAQPMQPITLNDDLVQQVQGVLARMPQAQRVYNGIINSEAATQLAPWRPSDVGGPSLARAFVRSTGTPLTDGIPGIYTYEGFNAVFLAEALGVAERIQRDAWVLGAQNPAEQGEAALAALSRDVLGLYYTDFVARYDALLAELDIVPLASLSHAVEVTNVLSGPTSPIANLLTAVARETALTAEPEAEAEAAEGASAAQVGAAGRLAAQTLRVKPPLSPAARRLLATMNTGGGAAGAQPEPPGQYVEDRFAWLQELVRAEEGQPSQLDTLMQSLTLVYQELNKLNFAGGVAAPDTQVSALAQFQADADRLGGPLQRWAQQIAIGSSGITAETTRASLNAQWQASVLPICRQATETAYPFDRRAAADIAMADFARLFAPGGLIEAFFTQNLADYVDTRTRPWSWQTVGGGDLGISPAVLQQFQHAAEIRDAFFAVGPAAGVQFQITPYSLDPGAEAVILEIDGQTISYQTGGAAPRPAAVSWPGPVGLARLTFLPPRAGSESTLNRDGPWGWFRMLDAAEIRDTSVSDRKRIIFSVGGRIAIFEMQAGAVLNPFALPALSAFRCPETF